MSANIDLLIKAKDETKPGVQNARRSLDTLKRAVNGIGVAAKFAAASIAALGVSAIGIGVTLAKDFIDAGIELDRWASRTGHSVEQLSALRYAAERTGLTLEDLTDVTEELRIKAYDAAEGSEAMASHFAELGINVEDFLALDADGQFDLLAEALKNVEDQTRQTILADELLSDSGKKLLTVINGNTEGWEGAKNGSRRR